MRHLSDQREACRADDAARIGHRIILALVSALVAPFVVDWNRYRSTFEQQASRLTGLAVRVNGTIDARILPSPRIKLRDVEVGEAGRAPRMRAGAIELELGLGPLVRGEVQATEVRLLTPQISLGLDRSGRDRLARSVAALSAPMRSPFRASMSKTAASFSKMRRPARTSCCKNFRSTATSARSSGRSRAKAAFVVGDELLRLSDLGQSRRRRRRSQDQARRRSVQSSADDRDRRHARVRSRRSAIRRHVCAGAAGRGDARGR